MPVPAEGKAGFTRLPPEATGIAFTNRLSPDRSITNQIYLNGSGVALGDLDGDGWCDILLCGLGGGSALYRNLGGWRFTNVTESAGLACGDLDATGSTFADLEGDGDLDLVVNSVGQGTHLRFNNGQGRFQPRPGLNPGRCGTSLALADIDGDGTLDLYVANYRTSTFRDAPQTKFRVNVVDGLPVIVRVNDRPVTDHDLVGRFALDPHGRIIEYGEPHACFRNDGHGQFTPIPFTGGAFQDEAGQPLTEPLYDWGLSVMFRDLNGDRAPDLYVCNDFTSPDRIWINNGRGQFRAIAALALRTTSIFSMGIDVADVNRDGHDDLFVSDMFSRSHALRLVQVGDVMPTVLELGRIDDRPQYSHNTLQLNRGDGTYAEISQYSDLQASEWTWCPMFLDVDLDGYEDLLVTTGHERDSMNADSAARIQAVKQEKPLTPREQVELNRLYPRLPTPNVAFRNRGDLTFEEVGRAWGYDVPGVSQGQAQADLDNDGDLDLVVNNLNGAAGLYRNDTPAPRLAVRLRGNAPNTRGIGARIRVLGGPVPQSQEMICGGRYVSSDDTLRVFAAGAATNELTVEVTWRSGRVGRVAGVRANSICEIDEAAGSPAPLPAAASSTPWFEDVSALVPYTHHDENFDDYSRQPLLPKKLSQLGPGVGWFDFDGDGREDLFVGTGKGGSPGVFLNDGERGFQRVTGGAFDQQVPRDQVTLLGWRSEAVAPTLLAGYARYEDGAAVGAMIVHYRLAGQAAEEVLPLREWSAGPLALADYDNDGRLDLFVGGRCVGGRYPEPASSLLLRRDGKTWKTDEGNSQALARIGLVSGAVWSDVNGDGWPDLVLACEWGPLRVFRNEQGRLTPWDPPLVWRPTTGTNAAARLMDPRPSTLSQATGFWNGVVTGDFDGDGRLDLVASNWGLNTKYRARLKRPRRLYYGDLAGAGLVDLVETYEDVALQKEVPDREFRTVRAALPFLAERVPTFAAYATASVQEVLGDRLSVAGVAVSTTLETIVLLNRGDHFEATPLPAEAQLAPAFGISIGDLDGDGAEDVFLSQNFFPVNTDYWRHDAGRGLLLKGDGDGGFRPIPGQVSGLLVYGDQRGCALADYDADGRTDLAVAQNGNALRLFRNRAARPGLRVRLDGPAGNPTGVGASLRLTCGNTLGPAREIRAGSGYWSQDSAVTVLATPSAPSRLWVRWPGGAITTSEIPAGALEVAVSAAGEVRRVR